MAVRWETAVGPNGVKRFVRVPEATPPPTLAEVDEELVALATDVETAAATVREIRQRTRVLVADARKRHAIRERLSPTRAQVRGAPAALTRQHVTRARHLVGKGQREVAAFCGLHRSQVAEAERGKRYIPESLGRWVMGVLRAAGEWED